MNPFDQFDNAPNPFDQFDAPPAQASEPTQSNGVGDFLKQQAKNAYVATHDVGRLMLNGATFGQADRLAAAINGHTLEQENQETARSADRAGYAGDVAKFLGVAAPYGVVSKGVGALAPLASPYARAALTGGAIGGGEAAGEGRDPLSGAIVGAAAGPLGEGAGNVLASGLRKVGSFFAKKPAIPSSEELSAMKDAAYRTADEAGGVVSPSASARLADALEKTGADFATTPELQPYANAAIRYAAGQAGQPVTMRGLDTLRKVAGRAWEGKPSDAELGGRLKGAIDEFTGSLGPGDYIHGLGDVNAADAAFKNARSLAQRSFKDQDLSDALEQARLRAASTGSGGNANNLMRQKVLSLYNSNTAWTPDERAAMLKVIGGGNVDNAARLAGKLSPEGNGLMLALEAGATAAGGGAHAIPAMAGGFLSKRFADAMTERRLNALGELIRAGGDKSALKAPPSALEQLAQSKRDALARGLSALGVTGEPQLEVRR